MDHLNDAFHYKAVQYILPYSSKLDYLTWCYSMFDIHVKSELIFCEQVVQHMYIVANNTQHRRVRKQDTYDSVVFDIVNDVVNAIPEKYHNTSLVQEWKKYGRKHTQNSSTLCLPPPKPHAPIVPYGHFDN